MKRSLFGLAMLTALWPGAGMAQPAPSASAGVASQAQDMRREVAQIATLRAQAHAAMLVSLSSAHRALLARLVGDVAVAAKPDGSAAVHELDAALSPAEAQAVVRAQRDFKKKMDALFEGIERNYERESAAAKSAPHSVVEHAAAPAAEDSDAGAILVRVVAAELMQPAQIFEQGAAH